MTKMLNFDRYALLNYLPKNGKCAEVGVALGKYSKLIHTHNKPSHLFLVDAWKYIDIGYKDSNMLSDQEQEKRYQLVCSIFAKNDNIKIIRKTSEEARINFEKNYFDWIFIDADHSYNGCYRDLKSWDPLVKEEGYICGHDYIKQGKKKEGFGVNEAVHKFLDETNYILTALTNENLHQTYVISKNQTSHEKFLEKV